MDVESARREVHPEEAPESERLLAVLDEAVAALRGADITFLLMGGLAASVLGRNRGVTDIDLFVRDRDVGSVLSALDDAGAVIQQGYAVYTLDPAGHGSSARGGAAAATPARSE